LCGTNLGGGSGFPVWSAGRAVRPWHCCRSFAVPFKHYGAPVIGESVEAALRQGLSAYRQEQADGGVPRQTVARWVKQFEAQAQAHLLHSLPALGLPATCAAPVAPGATRQTAAEAAGLGADGVRAPAMAGGADQESGCAVRSPSTCAQSAEGQAETVAEGRPRV